MTRFPGALTGSEPLVATWDAWNRLIGLSTTSGTAVAAYAYDGDWKRLKKNVGTNTTEYYYDDMRLAETRQVGAAGQTLQTESLVYDTRYLHSAACRDIYSGASHSSLITRHFFINDGNFNVTALVATNGTIVERYTYDPYGKVTIRDAAWQPITWDNSQKNVCLYTGHKFDAESGLYYSLYRYYHPGLGRWASRRVRDYGHIKETSSTVNNTYNEVQQYKSRNKINSFYPRSIQFKTRGCGITSEPPNKKPPEWKPPSGGEAKDAGWVYCSTECKPEIYCDPDIWTKDLGSCCIAHETIHKNHAKPEWCRWETKEERFQGLCFWEKKTIKYCPDKGKQLGESGLTVSLWESECLAYGVSVKCLDKKVKDGKLSAADKELAEDLIEQFCEILSGNACALIPKPPCK